jgi:MarR family transcriptional regulator, organic hydroperoxide resistance regulator
VVREDGTGEPGPGAGAVDAGPGAAEAGASAAGGGPGAADSGSRGAGGGPGAAEAGASAAGGGPVSRALFRVARLHRMLAGQLLRRVGLYPGQELLMMHLWETGPQRQSELVAVLGSDSATITRMVRRLEGAGFVRTRPDPTDGRAVIVAPTPAGLALRGQVEDLWRELERLTTRGQDPDQAAATLRMLEALERGLHASAAEGGARQS